MSHWLPALCRHAYLNWLVQLDLTTLQVTAISSKPIIQSDSYEVEGYFEGVLIVGSYHVIDLDGQQVSSSCRCLPDAWLLTACD